MIGWYDSKKLVPYRQKKFNLEPKQNFDFGILLICYLKLGHFGRWKATKIKPRHTEHTAGQKKSNAQFSKYLRNGRSDLYEI